MKHDKFPLWRPRTLEPQSGAPHIGGEGAANQWHVVQTNMHILPEGELLVERVTGWLCMCQWLQWNRLRDRKGRFSPVFFSHYLRGKYVHAYEKDARFILTLALCRSRSYIYFLLHSCIFVKDVSSLVKHTPFFVRCHFHIGDDWRRIVFDRCESDCWEIDSCEME